MNMPSSPCQYQHPACGVSILYASVSFERANVSTLHASVSILQA